MTYFRFPDEMPIRECWRAWKDITGTERDYPPDISDEDLEEDFERDQYCSVLLAKKLMRAIQGGTAYTLHCERDGSIFEVTPVTLKGNNSRFKYNHHL